MFKNETPLTPIYRLLINCIEQVGIDNPIKISEKIEVIKNHFTSFNANIIDNNDSDIRLIDETLKLLEMLEKNDKECASKYWDEIRSNQDTNKECDNCYLCFDCRSYYWNELGELFFNIENAEKKAGKYFPVRRVPAQLESFFEHTKSATELYLAHAIEQEKVKNDFLIVLKGMSSSTPSLLNSTFDTQTYDGGGFFIKCNGVGIAIDPGYHFIYNLHHYGLTVVDIDYVIITHEHIDHNSDMRLLDDLRSAVFQDIQKRGKKPLIWLMDKVSYQVAKIYQESETGFSGKKNVLYYVDPVHRMIVNDTGKEEKTKLFPDGIDIQFFLTKHIQNKMEKSDSCTNDFKKHTYGCRFCLVDDSDSTQKCSIVYTSDTAFFNELVEEIRDCDVLIANISGFYEDDIMKIKGKDRHLGYMGCYLLIKNMHENFGNTPKIMLLSEFWNGLMDIRFNVSKYLVDDLKQIGIVQEVLPAEEGFELALWDRKVKCTQCGKLVNHYHIQKPNGYNDRIKIMCNECFY